MHNDRKRPITQNEIEILKRSNELYEQELEKLSPVEELIWALIIFALGLGLLVSIGVIAA